MAKIETTSGSIGLSKWVFFRGLLSGPDELAGQPEYEAWKQETGKTDHEEFFSEKIAEHATMRYEQGISYSVYRPGDDEQTPIVHVGDFADEQGALKALITEKGEAYAWNQEGKALATRYESSYEAENTASSSSGGAGTIRVHERGIAPMRSQFIDQAGLESALVEAEQQVAKAGSIISARRFLRESGGQDEKLFQPNTEHSNSSGMLVWSDTNITVQSVGNHKYIVHDFKDIASAMAEQGIDANSMRTPITMRSPVKISYNAGKVSVQEINKSKELELPENDDREEDHEHE